MDPPRTPVCGARPILRRGMLGGCQLVSEAVRLGCVRWCRDYVVDNLEDAGSLVDSMIPLEKARSYFAIAYVPILPYNDYTSHRRVSSR
jgi:hypothetical protein